MMFSQLWIETKFQKFLDYIAQYRQEWDENKGMFKERDLFMISLATPLMFTEERAVIEDQ